MKLSELKSWLRRVTLNSNLRSSLDQTEDLLWRNWDAGVRAELFRNMRREAQIDRGEFVYYIVEEGTNIRQTTGGVPIIYSSVDLADRECNWTHEIVISVAAYNRLYGRFMKGD